MHWYKISKKRIKFYGGRIKQQATSLLVNPDRYISQHKVQNLQCVKYNTSLYDPIRNTKVFGKSWALKSDGKKRRKDASLRSESVQPLFLMFTFPLTSGKSTFQYFLLKEKFALTEMALPAMHLGQVQGNCKLSNVYRAMK